ncbi:MAG TPA: ParB N-terminal domain-containing protein [Spirochaetota bacterium]|jgi:ParB family chromosome partitioning protein|nr:ParB N-terminal domain-containing protein [Spirochaetota bacterium]HPV42773.1 ParB N-terminal domain-containing protein [Spirochaetota bacterium]
MKVLIDDIIIKRRIRTSLGDLTYLMESIGKFGLLNPITVTDNLELIAGYRRLQACKALGWKEIECTIMPAMSKFDKLLIEADENLTRKDLTIGEIERYEDEKRYLQSRGLERIRLWFIRLFKLIREWIRRYIFRQTD